MKNVLVTGGAGFIGSHFIRFLLNETKDVNVVNVDVLSYAGNLANCEDYKDDVRYSFYSENIGNYDQMVSILKKHSIDIVVNFAAESDNNKAITQPFDFVDTNVVALTKLLEACKIVGVSRFHHISTCEVFGQLDLTDTFSFSEESPYNPRTPYNASKAAGDHMVMAYYHTYGLPITISYCANNYGTHQFPEKVIPVFITKILKNQKIPLFKSSENKREWIHVKDHCRAIFVILERGKVGEKYTIGTGVEKSVEEIADVVIDLLHAPSSVKEIVPDRKSHDTRYLLDSSKIKHELGWQPEFSFEDSLPEIVEWYKNNPSWWEPLLIKSNSWGK